MNEGILRSPKWMRNFADFEINTGEDIKGEPSEKRKKEIEKEKRQKEEAKRQQEKERKEREEKEDKKEFRDFLISIIKYIYNNYKNCEISVPKNNYIIISKNDLRSDGIDLSFKIILDNTVAIPTFNVLIEYGSKKWNYEVTGVNYGQFKLFILNEIYVWHRRFGNQKKTNNQKKSTNTNKKTEPIDNKRRRYNLLLSTLDGFLREMDKIKEWEKKNPGKKHTDRESVQNQMLNVKDKINTMNKMYHFESRYYLKHLSHIFS